MAKKSSEIDIAVPVQEKVLPERLEEFVRALNDEKKQIEKDGANSIIVVNGKRVLNSAEVYLYQFEAEYVPNVPPDTPCKLVIANEHFEVTIVSYTEDIIQISAKKELPPSLGKARIDTGIVILLERLIKRIKENAEKENPAAERLLAGTDNDDAQTYSIIHPELYAVNKGDLIAEQLKAVNSALQNDITYIWGPPGTGKSRVIGRIILELFKHDRSVLMTSHTNVAVDGAIEKAFEDIDQDSPELKKADAPFPILRLGSNIELRDEIKEYVSPDKHLEKLGKTLTDERKDVLDNLAVEKARQHALTTIIKKSEWLKEADIHTIYEDEARLSEYDAIVKDKENCCRGIADKVKEYKTANPDIEEYDELCELMNRLVAEDYTLHNKYTACQEGISNLKQHIVDLDAEGKKRKEYDLIQEKLSDMLPLPTQKKLIDKQKNDIDLFNGNIFRYQQEMESCNKIIIKYENMNGLQKLFSSSSKYNEAKSRIKWLQDNIAENQKVIIRAKEQLKYYIECYETTQKLTYRKQELGSLKEIQSIFKQKNDSEKMIANLESEKEAIYNRIRENETRKNDIHRRISSISNCAIEYENLVGSLDKLTNEYNEVKVTRNNLRKLYEESLKAELCKISFKCMIDEKSTATDLMHLYKKVESELKNINQERITHELSDLEELISKQEERLNQIENELASLEKEIIANAKIIGTTLTKVFLTDEFLAREFDTVIIDEASMASIPAMWYACLLAKFNLIIVGDFLQLSPIVLAESDEAKKWLGTDIFFLNGVQELCRFNQPAKENIAKMNVQYRMDSKIANIANMYYSEYAKLETGKLDECKKKSIVEFKKWYKPLSLEDKKNTISIVDTASMHAWVNTIPTGWNKSSRVNVCTAALCVDMAFSMLGDYIKYEGFTDKCKVLIIAPYKPHADKIKQYVKIKYRALGLDDRCEVVKTGTIHRFQGAEADIVILDIVLDEPHFMAGIFNGKNQEINESYKRMFNVAITRAKNKLYFVGNIGFCKPKAKGAALGDLIRAFECGPHAYIEASKVLPNIVLDGGTSKTTEFSANTVYSVRDEDYFEPLKNDIRSSKNIVIIFSPFITQNRLGDMLPVMHDAAESGKKIIVITKASSDRKPAEKEEYKRLEKLMCHHGIHVIYKKGMHEKLVFIDEHILWQGSLNTLSNAGNTGEIMSRFDNIDYVKSMMDMMNIYKIIEAIDDDELVCPMCHEPLHIGDGQYGAYWACAKKDFSRSFNDPYPHEGELVCSKCGNSYNYKFDVEKDKKPRWVCSKDKKHYRYLKITDLKHEKMRSKIKTKKAQKELYKFYKDSEKKINGLNGKKQLITEFLEDIFSIKKNTTAKKNIIK